MPSNEKEAEFPIFQLVPGVSSSNNPKMLMSIEEIGHIHIARSQVHRLKYPQAACPESRADHVISGGLLQATFSPMAVGRQKLYMRGEIYNGTDQESLGNAYDYESLSKLVRYIPPSILFRHKRVGEYLTETLQYFGSSPKYITKNYQPPNDYMGKLKEYNNISSSLKEYVSLMKSLVEVERSDDFQSKILDIEDKLTVYKLIIKGVDSGLPTKEAIDALETSIQLLYETVFPGSAESSEIVGGEEGEGLGSRMPGSGVISLSTSTGMREASVKSNGLSASTGMREASVKSNGLSASTGMREASVKSNGLSASTGMREGSEPRSDSPAPAKRFKTSTAKKLSEL